MADARLARVFLDQTQKRVVVDDDARREVEPAAPAALAAELEQVLIGRARGPHQDALVLGAGLLLELTGRAPGLSEGIAAAEKTITDGEAGKFLRQLRAFSESMP